MVTPPSNHLCGFGWSRRGSRPHLRAQGHIAGGGTGGGRAGTLVDMPKNYLVAALTVLAAVLTAGVGVAILRRTRQDPPPVSPTVPRVEEVREALAESTESQAS
ncbi:hypothetical protein GONAM_52_00570 [Gordonia namibiensis NBRC 108229]|uniref:Uncharacterized protein n=2 Tax=Gordoniaceae TaxID=85026 RepID=K6WSE7_9ACTN|nr:hypothetical protein GONAM_52_00570 [Gordonia namibiensis NBRC 108229]